MTDLLGLRYDCPRCGTRHVTACCHASRHNKCDRCVAEQHAERAERAERCNSCAGKGGGTDGPCSDCRGTGNEPATPHDVSAPR